MKIITHGDRFHADEVFAIALLFETFGECPVERRDNRYVSPEEFNDPDVWILDISRKLDSSKHVFDHHQHAGIDSTNMLVLYNLTLRKAISNELYELLSNDFKAISEIDRNGYDGQNGFQVNSLIASLNTLEKGFDKAIDIARSYIRAKKVSVLDNEKSLEIWALREVIGEAAFCKEYPSNWKYYDQEKFLIFPKDGGFALQTINSKLYPLVRTGTEVFFHESGFFAVYKTKEDAILGALKSTTLEKAV